jgi:hypothetical protein
VQHSAKMPPLEKDRLGPLAGDIQNVSTGANPHVEMYTIDGMRLVAHSMALGLSSVWYCDTTGDLVSVRDHCCCTESVMSRACIPLVGGLLFATHLCQCPPVQSACKMHQLQRTPDIANYWAACVCRHCPWWLAMP